MKKRVISYILTLVLVITSIIPMNMIKGEAATDMTNDATESDVANNFTEETIVTGFTENDMAGGGSEAVDLSSYVITGYGSETDDSSSDVITGQCGPYAYFEYGKDKVLRISGKSEINTKYFKDIHDAGISGKVKKIVMENTITGIADNAFAGFTNLEKVEMSCNMIRIGEYAFGDCTSLKSIIIPRTTTYIADYAFSNCTGLEYVYIFMNEGALCEEAFAGCTGMKSLMFVSSAWKDEITIPSKWPESLEILYPNLNSTYYPLYSYGRENGITMYGLKEGNTSVAGPDNYVCYSNGVCVVYGYGELGEMSSYAVNIIVAHGITSFKAKIFDNCTSVETIVLPESLTVIDVEAFTYLTSLKEMVIPSGVESVGNRAFKGCKSMETITFMNPDTVIGTEVIPETVTKVYGHAGSTAEAYALANGFDFEEIVFDEESDKESDEEETTQVEQGEVEETTSEDAEQTTSEESTTENSTEDDDTPSTDVVITGQCGPDAYFEFGKDNVLRISGSGEINTENYKDLINAEISNKVVKIVLGENITSVAQDTFEYYTALEEVEFSYALETIEENAFGNCTSLRRVFIPASVTTIENYAFFNCANIEEIYMVAEELTMGELAFYGCNSVKVLCSICNNNYETFPVKEEWAGSLEKIYHDTLVSQSTIVQFLNKYELSMVNGFAHPSPEGCRVFTEGLAIYYQNVDITESSTYMVNVFVTNGVKNIGNRAFAGCNLLETIVLPETIKTIGSGAFSGCTSLKGIVISMGVESLGDKAFDGCTNLESITFMNPDTVIGVDAIPSTVTKIYGHPGSTAEAYATEKGLSFIEVVTGDVVEEETTIEETTTEEIATVEETTTEVSTEEESTTVEEESTEDSAENESQTTEETDAEDESQTTEETDAEDESQTTERTVDEGESRTIEETSTEGESTDETTTIEIQTVTETTTVGMIPVVKETSTNNATSGNTASGEDSTSTEKNVTSGDITTKTTFENSVTTTTQITEQKATDKKQSLAKPVIKKIKENNYRSAKITWKKVKGAKSYKVYRATKKKGKYKLLKTTTKTTYTDKKVKAGKKYYYKIKVVGDGNKTKLSKVKKIKIKGTPNRPKITVKKTSDSWSIVWGTIGDNSKGIEIYMKNGQGKYKKFTRINTTTNLKKAKKKKGVTGISSSINSLQAGLKYQFRARTYAVVKGKKVYSKWSKIKMLRR